MASQCGDERRPPVECLTKKLSDMLKNNSEWMMRSIRRKRVFNTQDEKLALEASSECGLYHFASTVAQCQKALSEIDEHVFLFKLSGHDDVRRDLELYRDDAVLWQRVWTKQPEDPWDRS